MDPLSIAASIVTLIGTANQVAVGLNTLASLKRAPAAILALNSEVSDLRLVLCETEPLSRKHKEAKMQEKAHEPMDSALLLSIDRAKDKLLEMETIVQTRIMTRMGTLNKLGWLREQDKVNRTK